MGILGEKPQDLDCDLLDSLGFVNAVQDLVIAPRIMAIQSQTCNSGVVK
jgi:hypothetical protein